MKNILLLLMTLLPALPNQKVEIKDMIIEWRFLDATSIQFKLYAPTRGWVAIGINDSASLVGSNLIMASVRNNETIISDRYIKGFGDHRSMESLKSNSHVTLIYSNETEKGTEIHFNMKTIKMDEFHQHLEKGKSIYLTAAYSRDDDFNHHSIMRQSMKIIL